MTFSAPLFLIGLLAVAIPIVVHLFNFRRYKKVYFSNVERLEQLQSETRRQSNLRELLILAARVLAIVFLVLAFARPVLRHDGGPLRTGSNDVSIFIDNSFSMGTSDGERPLLDKAKEKAREIVRAYGPSDRFQLLTGDMEGRHFHWLSQEEVLLQIDAVELSGASPSLSAVAERQEAFLRSGTGQNRNLFVVSDFQATMADLADFPADSSVQVTFVPLEAADQGNVYIDSVAFNAPVYQQGGRATVEVWLRNDGDENLEKVPLALYVNDKQRAMASPDLAARASTVVPLHFAIDQAGVLSGRIEIVDYPVTFDDRYYFTLNVNERVKGLLVEGDGSNEFLRRLFEGDSSVALTTMGVQQMDFSRLEGNDFVLLDALPTLSSGMAQSLHAFVEGGGTLVLVLPAAPDVEAYNAALSLFGAPLLDGLHKGRVAAATVHTDHALYRNVFAGKNDELEMPTVGDYQRLASSGATIKEPLITLANGDDYLTVTPCGTGRLYLVAAPLRDTHTDFVRQALFVPTLYNMALYSVRPVAPAATLGSTEPLSLGHRYDGGTVRMVSVDGSYEGIPDLRHAGGNSRMVLHDDPSAAGNYLLLEADATEPSEGLSLNYSRQESQMRFLGRDALSSLVKDHNLTGCSVVRNVDKPLDTYLKEQMTGRSLWRWCLMLSLLMLLIEILLIRLPLLRKAKPKDNK